MKPKYRRLRRVDQVYYQDNLWYPRATKIKIAIQLPGKAWVYPFSHYIYPRLLGISPLCHHLESEAMFVSHPVVTESMAQSLQSSQQEERQIPTPTCPSLHRTPAISAPRTLSQISHMAPAVSCTRRYMTLCACDI